MSKELKEIFNTIAPSWYGFRHHTIFRKELTHLAESWRKGKLLNAGCGHGADFIPFKDNFDLYGIDFSAEMIKLAHKYTEKHNFKANLKVEDIRSLPFSDNYFDWAIAIASYHHLDGKEDREKALQELFRVLKPGGEAFLTVWNKWQSRFFLKGKDTLVPFHYKGKTYLRYYHLFSYGEIENLVKQAGFTLLDSFAEHSYSFPVKYFSRNICIHIKKP